MSRSGVTSAASAGNAAIVTPASMDVVRRFMSSSPVRTPARTNGYELTFHRLPWALRPPSSSQTWAPPIDGSYPQHTTVCEVPGRGRDFRTCDYPGVAVCPPGSTIEGERKGYARPEPIGRYRSASSILIKCLLSLLFDLRRPLLSL